MNPALTTALMLGFASVLCFLVWLAPKQPNITSNALLVRAETWDAISSSQSAGIIRQTVGIKAPKERIYRTIYRDAQGKRRPKPQNLAYGEEKLRNTLASVGVTWDAPLSATAYQQWHDSQRVRQDQIEKSGKNLVLTTTIPDGLVAEQTLTVRNSDFHPVQRTVVFRDRQTIEIAELEYQVLPWKEVDADLFESESIARAEAPIRLQPELVPRMPSFPTEEQLDEAELSARLALNQLRADTGEQIRIDRDAQGVKVKGLVETDKRKEELEAQLRLLSRVSVSILSMEELSKHPEPNGTGANANIASGAAERSPLDTYFLSQGRGLSTDSGIPRQLMDSALTVEQESRAIIELSSRFGAAEKMTDLAAATLSELLFTHREHLLNALQQSQDLLRKSGLTVEAKPASIDSGRHATLLSAAEKNLALCRELTFAGNSPPRDAESIAADFTAASNEVRERIHETRLRPQSTAAAGASK